MSKIGNFTQPDNSPAYFIDFLQFLDNHDDIKNFRAEAAKRLKLAPGSTVLDVGCGIGGATFPLAETTGPNGLAAGVDISSAMIEVASGRCGQREGLEFRVGQAGAIPYPGRIFRRGSLRKSFSVSARPDRGDSGNETCCEAWRPGLHHGYRSGLHSGVFKEACVGAEDDVAGGGDDAKSQIRRGSCPRWRGKLS
jgi:SAM-dependent methyltransferase